MDSQIAPKPTSRQLRGLDLPKGNLQRATSARQRQGVRVYRSSLGIPRVQERENETRDSGSPDLQQGVADQRVSHLSCPPTSAPAPCRKCGKRMCRFDVRSPNPSS